MTNNQWTKKDVEGIESLVRLREEGREVDQGGQEVNGNVGGMDQVREKGLLLGSCFLSALGVEPANLYYMAYSEDSLKLIHVAQIL